MPSRNTTYAATQAWAATWPVRISRYIIPAQSTASTAESPVPGSASWTRPVASATPTRVPPKRATAREYVWEKSGRITMTEAMGAQ